MPDNVLTHYERLRPEYLRIEKERDSGKISDDEMMRKFNLVEADLNSLEIQEYNNRQQEKPRLSCRTYNALGSVYTDCQ